LPDSAPVYQFQNIRSSFLRTGRNVAVDPTEAIKWYQSDAAQNYAQSREIFKFAPVGKHAGSQAEHGNCLLNRPGVAIHKIEMTNTLSGPQPMIIRLLNTILVVVSVMAWASNQFCGSLKIFQIRCRSEDGDVIVSIMCGAEQWCRRSSGSDQIFSIICANQ
jgi:hypothetical protein